MPKPRVVRIGTVEVIECCVIWTLDFASFKLSRAACRHRASYESPPFSVFGNSWCLYLIDTHDSNGEHSNFGLKYMSGHSQTGVSVRSIQSEASLLRYGQLTDHAEPSSVSSKWVYWSKFLKDDVLTHVGGYLENNMLSIHVQLWLLSDYDMLDCSHGDLDSNHDTPSVTCPDDSKCPTNDHFSQAFNKWHNDRACTDMTVEVGGEHFEIHRFVFASRSNVFYRMFSQDMSESNTRSMKISDMVPEVFKQLVEYMYTGKIVGLQDSASDLLYAAEKYELEGLKGICADALKKTITEDTALNVLLLADLYRAQELKNVALSFVKGHGQEVTYWEGWTNLLTNKPDLATEVVRYLIPSSTVNPPPLKRRKTVK